MSAAPSQTIAFIHGAFVSQHCWEPWIARCEARGYACVAIAYPGREGSVAELRREPDAAVLRTLTLDAVAGHCARVLAALPEKPLVIGHSFGGLLTQLMLQRDLAAAAVAIDSVPPQGVTTLKWSFLRSLWPLVNPLIPSTRPYFMPFEHFCYTFGNDLAPAQQRAVYEALIVPESRRLGRDGLTRAARVDFERPHAPLLMVAGERDHLMPPSLNRRNQRRYRGPSVADFKQFPGRAHFSIIGGEGWEEVADHALDWAVRMGSLAPCPARSAAAPPTRSSGAARSAARKA